MGKQIVLLMGVALLFACLLLSGCPQVSTPPGSAPPAFQYVCPDGRTTVANITQCPPVAVAPAVRTLTLAEEMSVCAGMPAYQSNSIEDVCLMGIAAKHENATLCTEVIRDQRANCYFLVAEVKSDPDICAEADQADQCYEQYARAKSDATVCDRITNAGNRNNCYSNLANALSDPAICDKITDVNNRDSCYSNLASQTSDPALCAKIRSTSQKDNCYSNVASRLGDSSYCEQITSVDQKQNCLQNLQGRSGGDIPRPQTVKPMPE